MPLSGSKHYTIVVNKRDKNAYRKETTTMSMINKFKEKIKGSLSTFDRMIFKGHFCFMHKKENRYYLLSQEKVLLKDFGKFALKVTGQIKDSAKKIAEEANRPYIYLNSPKASKEEIAKKIMETDNIQQGLICVLGSVELCRAFSVVSNKERKELELNFMDRKCMYLYFYYLDEEFGFMHIRLQTWFPFDIRVYINGREYLSRQLDAAGISYDRYENSFLNISDLEKAQELANRLLTKKWDRTFDNFAHKVNPYLKRINKIFGKGYFWGLDQCEYATDVMFKSRNDLMSIYPDLVEHASLSFSSKDVMTFLGRKLNNNFLGEIVSDKKFRPQGVRVKHRMKENNIKMYDKWSVLRIETTINNPREFKIYKEAMRKGELRKTWVPMGKSISNVYRYAQVSQESNMRYLNALSAVEDTSEVVAELEELCESVQKNKKRYSGFNPVSKASCDIFLAVLNGSNCINGFSNKDIRNILYPNLPANSAVAKKISGRITRLLIKMRAHKLIAKIPHSFRYTVTKKGTRVMSAALKLKRKDFPQFLMTA